MNLSWNDYFYTRCFAAFVSIDINGRSHVVVGTGIGYRRITEDRRGNQADVNFPPSGSVRTAIDVIARNVVRRGCLPVQVYHMVGTGLNCDGVGMRRRAFTTARDLDREGIRCRLGRSAFETQRNRFVDGLHRDAGRESPGGDGPSGRRATSGSSDGCGIR